MAKGDEYSSVEHEWFTALEAKLVHYEYQTFRLAVVINYLRGNPPVENGEQEPIKAALAEGFRWIRTDHWCWDGSDWAVFEKQVV
jgi:hypothetical protein